MLADSRDVGLLMDALPAANVVYKKNLPDYEVSQLNILCLIPHVNILCLVPHVCVPVGMVIEEAA